MLYRVAELSRTYARGSSTLTALDSVAVEIDQGEHVALVGPSGSGKTTLLNILGLLDSEFKGRVSFADRDIAGLSASELARLRLREIGFVFQGFHLLPFMNVRDNVALPHWRLHGDRAGAAQKADALLARVGLTERATHHPKELSGGELQRAAVARAAINEPRVILADEPTGNLDASNSDSVLELFRGLNDEGCALVVVSHNQAVAAAASRAVQLEHGRVVAAPAAGDSQSQS